MYVYWMHFGEDGMCRTFDRRHTYAIARTGTHVRRVATIRNRQYCPIQKRWW